MSGIKNKMLLLFIIKFDYFIKRYTIGLTHTNKCLNFSYYLVIVLNNKLLY